MVTASTAVTMLGLVGGIATTLTSLALSKRLRNREVSEKEIVLAMIAVGVGSATAVWVLKKKRG